MGCLWAGRAGHGQGGGPHADSGMMNKCSVLYVECKGAVRLDQQHICVLAPQGSAL